MATISSTKIPIAVGNHTKLDLTCDHATTMAFMTLQPVFYRHMTKTEHLNIDCISNVRPMPMVVPTYGRIRQNLRGFFVPYRLIFPQWQQFYNDVVGVNYNNSSLVSGVPYINAHDIHALFLDVNCSDVVGATDPYDFIDANGDYRKFTTTGRKFYKTLYSLGYDIVGNSPDFEFNALALLALVKIHLDWYSNQQYMNTYDVIYLRKLLAFNDPSSRLHISAADLLLILTFVSGTFWDSYGYFEGAWDNPTAPNNNQYSTFTFTDPTSTGGVSIATQTDGTPVMYQNTPSTVSVGTKYVHDALQRLSEYQKRHQLAGSLSIDRILAQFGIVPDAVKMERSIYVGSQSNDIQIGDVYATSASTNGTETSNVGDYAGRGFGSGSKSWDFRTDDEGIFIVLASIQPSGGYYQGYDRNNRNLSKTDFLVPEFDALGVQAIERGEVYVSKDNRNFIASSEDYAKTFGFTGRYGEKKRPLSRVSGDFALHSNPSGNVWHLMREFTDSYFNGTINSVVHNWRFTQGDPDQFNRIFNYVGDEKTGLFDPFYCFLHFTAVSYAPCRPLMETFDWEDLNEKITADSGSAKLN